MTTELQPRYEPEPEDIDDTTETERVFRAIGEWQNKMLSRGIERIDDPAARYHLGLMIKALLQEHGR